MSKTCPKCKSNLPDTATFCNFCGTRFSAGSVNPQPTPQPQPQPGSINNGMNQGGGASYSFTGNVPQEYQEMLVNKSEQFGASLKDSGMKTFMAGDWFGTNKIFFTNKRLYAKTNRFSFRRGIFTDQFIVELDEITGTHLIHKNPIQWLVLAAIALIAAIATEPVLFIGVIIFAIVYFLSKGTYLEISYAGDTTELSVKMYTYNTVMDFHKKLHQAMGV